MVETSKGSLAANNIASTRFLSFFSFFILRYILSNNFFCLINKSPSFTNSRPATKEPA